MGRRAGQLTVKKDRKDQRDRLGGWQSMYCQVERGEKGGLFAIREVKQRYRK